MLFTCNQQPAVRRLREYLRFLAWQSGLCYLALWIVTLWALDRGFALFVQSGVCRVDRAAVLFYWSCEPTSALTLLAVLVNAAFTTTIWAPVFIAAATVDLDAVAIALPIVLVHVVGLPTAIFVVVRILLMLLARLWPALGRISSGGTEAALPSKTAIAPQP